MRENEGPLEEDVERFSDVTRTCPSCKKETYDDADICHHCGHAMIMGTSAASDKGLPTWAMITAGIVLAAFVLTVMWR